MNYADTYTYADHFKAFVRDRADGATLRIDREMWEYWRDVLPPVWMNRKVTLPSGREVMASFGFAEGPERVTAFWREGQERFACLLAERARG